MQATEIYVLLVVSYLVEALVTFFDEIKNGVFNWQKGAAALIGAALAWVYGYSILAHVGLVAVIALPAALATGLAIFFTAIALYRGSGWINDFLSYVNGLRS